MAPVQRTTRNRPVSLSAHHHHSGAMMSRQQDGFAEFCSACEDALMLVQHYNTSEISCCVKYTIFGFNVLFWIIGFALLAVGVWAHFEKNSAYSHLNKASRFYLDPAIFLIFAGRK
ncbi:hypothetical protein WUBG_13250 [Wuchereria bancrofti]|uniref:Uncharacterized protein n=1 Tax=Wuchereria bancrofti TaxID=6293 RepID=J9ANG6_WUCBA|nr:hypothetical protein WUBG_13250 [Wuchereria bancrofti]